VEADLGDVMELKEIKEEKRKLQTEINNLLEEFIKRTEIDVVGIKIVSHFNGDKWVYGALIELDNI
jgi:hypothetical protein